VGQIVLKKIFPRKRDRVILLPAIGSQLIVSTSLFLLPLLIATLNRDAGLSGESAGLLLSVELGVSALTTFCLSVWVRKHSARHWALAGALLTVAASGLTLISPALPALFATRLVAGIGEGVVGAEATSVLSLGVARERLISVVTIISIVHAAFWLAVLPYLIDRWGYRGPYACLLMICLAGAWLLRRLPSLFVHHDPSKQSFRSVFTLYPALVIVAVFLTQLGQGAFWTLEETYARHAGFNSHVIGALLGVATLLLLLGAAGAGWAGDRFGRFPSLIILVALNAASILVISTIAFRWMYVGANVLQSVTNLSSLIFQLGLAASLDRSGRAVAVSTGMVTLGNGLGPSLAAGLSGAVSAPFVGVFVLGLNAVALALYCGVKSRGVEGPQMSAALS
jgi:predicted MFS family arabinose efflux permease